MHLSTGTTQLAKSAKMTKGIKRSGLKGWQKKSLNILSINYAIK